MRENKIRYKRVCAKGSLHGKSKYRQNQFTITEILKTTDFEGNVKCRGRKGDFRVLGALNSLTWVIIVWIQGYR
jgi:hypothetical protein